MIPLYDWPDHGRAGSNPRVMDDRREWSETQMKRILLLATGGTIASRAGQDGLEPQPAPPELLHALDELSVYYNLTYRALMSLDSSNIQAEEWQQIARSVYDALPEYDGVIITHGTDTMAYTASMLSFMLQNLNKGVILTGSQIPIGMPLSDARSNLETALAAIDSGVCGVHIAFNHKIIGGCRAVKVRTMGFDAFESVNSPDCGEILSNGVRLYNRRGRPSGPVRLCDALCNDVFLLKLIPGTNPRIFDSLLELRYRGVVIEAFGAGGMHYIRRDLSAQVRRLVENGVAVVTCSQCLYDGSDFSIYEAGRRILGTGVIESRDMTTESAVTKLMGALGQTDRLDEVRRIFETDYAGEITL